MKHNKAILIPIYPIAYFMALHGGMWCAFGVLTAICLVDMLSFHDGVKTTEKIYNQKP